VEFGKFNRRDRDSRNRGNYPNRDQEQGGFNRSQGGFRERGERFNDRDQEESVFSKKVRAGKRRTYFMDVRRTRGSDYFITITESTRRDDGFGYKRHKIFLYKEDFNRFLASLNEVVDHVKKDLMPEFDYEEFDRRQAEWEAQNRDSNDADDMDRNGGDDSEWDAGDDSPKKKDDDEMTW